MSADLVLTKVLQHCSLLQLFPSPIRCTDSVLHSSQLFPVDTGAGAPLLTHHLVINIWACYSETHNPLLITNTVLLILRINVCNICSLHKYLGQDAVIRAIWKGRASLR